MPEVDEVHDTYTVVEGDTLWGIAVRLYGDGRQWRRLYDANSSVITADAQRFVPDRVDPEDPGHWIFPGQTFIVPPK